MATIRNQRRHQRQHLGIFGMMVIKAIVTYNDIRRCERHLPKLLIQIVILKEKSHLNECLVRVIH